MTLAFRIFLFLVTVGLTIIASPSSLAQDERSDAPDFRLQDQNGDWHALSDFRGQWLVVYFYPRADTPGCTTQGCSFRDNIYAFRGVGAEVVGISTDPIDRQKAFSDKYQLPFAILSDEAGTVADRYGVLIESGNMNFARRETFLIDPEGRIAKHYPHVNPDRHTEEVLDDLLELSASKS
jgi:peroxiredoxin Q/BCP